MLEPTPVVWHERTAEAPAGPAGRPRRAVVELRRYAGPRYMYGLLGAEFQPGSGGRITVRVAVASSDGPAFSGSLLSGHDVVRAGLPAEYAGAVMEGVFGAPELRALGPGVVRFDTAAHAEASSSRAEFRRVADVVVRLLVAQPESQTEEQLARLVIECV